MAYVLRGNLWGYICRECPRPLWGVVVRFYEPESERLIERAVADPKSTTAALDEKAVRARARRLLAETVVGEDGNFEVSFDRKKGYKGGPVDIDIRVAGVRELPEQSTGVKPRQVHITTLQPLWREEGRDRLAYWQYYLPARIWCLILSWFDIWVICGRVTICETDRVVPGVTVEARDVDWIQQDYLGSAVTDATGRFIIYYPGSAFRKGTWANIELTEGADLYFKITYGSLTLLAEPPSRGRQPDRENVGNCFCVELCVKDVPKLDEGFALFSHVGVYNWTLGQVQHGVTGANAGLSSDNRAFYSTMRLHGVLPQTINYGRPLEYCFEWQEVDAAGNPIAGSAWTQVTQAQIARTVIGKWYHYTGNPLPAGPWDVKDYTVNGTAGPGELVASFTADGWIKVPQENTLFGPAGAFQPNGNQINLISPKLVPSGPSPAWGSIDMTGKVAGASAAPVGAHRFFAIRMQARDDLLAAQTLPAGELPKIAINNTGYDNIKHHPYWAGYTDPPGTLGVNMLGIGELEANGCAKIQNTLTVKVTAAHPTLGAVSLSLIGGNAATVVGGGAVVTPPAAGLPKQRFGVATLNFNPANLSPCAYLLSLSTQLLLTTGDSVPSNLVDQIAFAKA